MDYNYTIFDIGTFIALFCFDLIGDPSAFPKVLKGVLKEYLRHRSLSDYEQAMLPDVVAAAYAANVLIPAFLQKTGSDENPKQTIYYQHLGRGGLKMLESIKLSI